MIIILDVGISNEKIERSHVVAKYPHFQLQQLIFYRAHRLFDKFKYVLFGNLNYIVN